MKPIYTKKLFLKFICYLLLITFCFNNVFGHYNPVLNLPKKDKKTDTTKTVTKPAKTPINNPSNKKPLNTNPVKTPINNPSNKKPLNTNPASNNPVVANPVSTTILNPKIDELDNLYKVHQSKLVEQQKSIDSLNNKIDKLELSLNKDNNVIDIQPKNDNNAGIYFFILLFLIIILSIFYLKKIQSILKNNLVNKKNNANVDFNTNNFITKEEFKKNKAASDYEMSILQKKVADLITKNLNNFVQNNPTNNLPKQTTESSKSLNNNNYYNNIQEKFYFDFPPKNKFYFNKKNTNYKANETFFLISNDEFDLIQEPEVLNNFFNNFTNYQNTYSGIVQIKIEKSNYGGFSGIITEKKGRINKTADSYEIISPLIIKLI